MLKYTGLTEQKLQRGLVGLATDGASVMTGAML